MSVDRLELSNLDWIKLVKATREKFGVGIDEAHRLILEDSTMRRLIISRVNRDRECRKIAYAHIRQTGDLSLLVENDGRFRWRKQTG